MSSITLQLPDEINLDPKDTIKFIAAKLYESGKLTLGQAAGLCGLSKVSFAELLGDYNVFLINHPVSEMVNDAKRI